MEFLGSTCVLTLVIILVYYGHSIGCDKQIVMTRFLLYNVHKLQSKLSTSYFQFANCYGMNTY